MSHSIFPDEYRTLLVRRAKYVKHGQKHGLSYEQAGEMQRMTERIRAIEEATATGSNATRLSSGVNNMFEQVTDDYHQLRQMGDLGGVEVWEGYFDL